MPNEYELMPKYDARASFYGKARVRVTDPGNEILYSYGTPVCWIDAATKNMHRLWGGWSSTTGRHIKEFWRQHAGSGRCDKRAWEELEVEPKPEWISG